jgi:O-antigen ligase
VSAVLGVWQFLTPGGFNSVFGRFTDSDMRFFMDYWALDIGRVGALWVHAPQFAAFLGALLPAFLCLWLSRGTLSRALFASAGFILATITLVLTGTRVEFIGAVAGVVVMLAAWGVRVNSLSRVRAGILSTLVAALIVASLLSARGSAEGNVFGRFFRLFQGDPAAADVVAGRKAVYGALLDTWRSNPILGVGLGNTQEATKEATAFTGWRALTSPHSYYLGLLAQTGLVGTGLVLVMLGAMIPHYRRLLRRAVGSRERAFGSFALAVSVAVLVGGVADNAMLYMWQLGVVFWLLQGGVLSLSLLSEERPDTDGEERSMQEAADAQ